MPDSIQEAIVLMQEAEDYYDHTRKGSTSETLVANSLQSIAASLMAANELKLYELQQQDIVLNHQEAAPPQAFTTIGGKKLNLSEDK